MSHTSQPAKRRPPLDEALAAAALGFLIFPLQPQTKLEYKTGDRLDRSHATTDTATIRAWFSEGLAYNVGALMPPGRVCVDVDKKRLPKFTHTTTRTREDFTPGEGLHLFYDLPTGMQCKPRINRPECEIFGTGGRVVMAGSSTGAGEYITIDDSPIAPAPEWLLQIVATTGQPVEYVPAQIVEKVEDGDRYGRAALLGETDKVRKATEGNCYNTLNTAALKLGGLVPGGYLTATEIETNLLAATSGWNSARNWAQIIKKGIADGEKRPRNVTPREVKKTTREAIAVMKELVVETPALSKGKLDTGIPLTEKHNYTKAQALTVRAGILGILDRANQANTLDLHLSQRDLAKVGHMNKRSAWKVIHAARRINLLELVDHAGVEEGATYRLTLKGFLALQQITKRESSTSPTEKESDSPSSSSRNIDDSLLRNFEPSTIGAFRHGSLGRAGELVLKALGKGLDKVPQIVVDTGLATETARRALKKLVVEKMVEKDGRVYAVAPEFDSAMSRYIARSTNRHGKTLSQRDAAQENQFLCERETWLQVVEAQRTGIKREAPAHIATAPELSPSTAAIVALKDVKPKGKPAPKLQSQVDEELRTKYFERVGLT